MTRSRLRWSVLLAVLGMIALWALPAGAPATHFNDPENYSQFTNTLFIPGDPGADQLTIACNRATDHVQVNGQDLTYAPCSQVQHIQIFAGDGNDIVNTTAVTAGGGFTALPAAPRSGEDEDQGLIVQGDSGDDTITDGVYPATLDGSDGANTVSGGGGNDVVRVIFNSKGPNRLDGGDGNDIIGGSYGRDELFGGAGKDVFSAWAGKDKVFGGAGKDKMDGSGGDDKLVGGKGRDTAFGGPGRDKCVAEKKTGCEK
jgi:Ca2+-binding RTX toxin-like protein